METVKGFARFASLYLGLASVLAGFLVYTLWPEKARAFYVHPCESQYCVYLSTNGHNDPLVSKPLPLEDAADLAETLNDTVGTDWSK